MIYRQYEKALTLLVNPDIDLAGKLLQCIWRFRTAEARSRNSYSSYRGTSSSTSKLSCLTPCCSRSSSALMYALTRLHVPTSSWLCAPAVFMDGLQLKMRPSETQQQHVLDDLGGSSVFSLNWDLQFPELGNTAEITSAFMRVVVWLSPETSSAEVSQLASSLPGQLFSLYSSGASVCANGLSGWASARLVRTWLAKHNKRTPAFT